jgi:hypothetical protein
VDMVNVLAKLLRLALEASFDSIASGSISAVSMWLPGTTLGYKKRAVGDKCVRCC